MSRTQAVWAIFALSAPLGSQWLLAGLRGGVDSDHRSLAIIVGVVLSAVGLLALAGLVVSIVRRKLSVEIDHYRGPTHLGDTDRYARLKVTNLAPEALPDVRARLTSIQKMVDGQATDCGFNGSHELVRATTGDRFKLELRRADHDFFGLAATNATSDGVTLASGTSDMNWLKHLFAGGGTFRFEVNVTADGHSPGQHYQLDVEWDGTSEGLTARNLKRIDPTFLFRSLVRPLTLSQ